MISTGAMTWGANALNHDFHAVRFEMFCSFHVSDENFVVHFVVTGFAWRIHIVQRRCDDGISEFEGTDAVNRKPAL